ncbi:glycosyltransferase [Rubrivirga sp. S365]|uniref:glycosyltransferase n=1 Tax=Rubrivirga sp. S365 TaxID=3076080 RepID=UPI0028D83CA9|nr:glycosyltransferase [Rubrivirga sp. S365]
MTRAAAVLAHVRAEATLFTSAEPPPLPDGVACVRLPPDDPEAGSGGAERVSPEPFHYAPVGHGGVRQRMAQIAAWAAEGPGALVADVSVEVATLGRLLSLPVVIVRQHGARWDGPHRTAYGLAERLLAPFPPSLEEPDAPAWVREKTAYVGGFSRFDGRPAPPRSRGARRVVVLGGGGAGGAASGRAWGPGDLAAAARATPRWRWTVLGAATPPGSPDTLEGAGWVADPWTHLASASVVVATAGHNAVMEAAAAGRPLVVVPEPRPFDEQARKAAALDRIGAAVACPRWPEPAAWPALLDRALGCDTAPLRALADGGGAARAAAVLDDVARGAG